MDIWHVLLIAISVSLAVPLFSRGNNNENETRIAYIERKLERKLDLLLKHFGIEEQGYSADDDLVDLILSGRKIEAVKLYRELHPHENLKNAVRAVEHLIRQHGTK
ncbi:hypothetical protein [Leptolyngbya sp. FACHB-261]|uniref:hypothetical protein n=1 Tax=Leptolyngbya sp. FACHB-261 TaxID=2692806 RepID=UPI00168560AC|nr:hypothetical protein [Leptolyngbya sp. FACHB-261]MBD2103948.1 hypothetical protein [Leptolyngbya sp. FACHB-261]